MVKYLKQVKITLEKKDNIESFKICNSTEAVDALKKIINPDMIDVSETVVAIFFNQSSNSVGWFLVSQGGINQSIIDLRILFSAALNCLATKFIICHNHPSGNLTPSIQDKEITKKIKQAGEILNIELIDHIIISENGHYSFCDEGIL